MNMIFREVADLHADSERDQRVREYLMGITRSRKLSSQDITTLQAWCQNPSPGF